MIPATDDSIRVDLSLFMADFDVEMDRQGFIAHRVLPIMARDTATGEYPRLELSAMLHAHVTVRGERGEYNRSSTKWIKDNYATEDRGLEAILDDRTVAKYRDYIDAEQWETKRIIDGVLRTFEIETADKVFDASTFPTYASPTPWSTLTADIPGMIRDNRENIVMACGYEPNALICNREVFRWIRDSDSVIDKIKAQNFQDVRPSEISAAQLAQSLDIEQVIVSSSLQNMAPVNSPNSQLSRIWPSTMAMLAKVATSGDPAEVGIGKTVQWVEEGARYGDEMGVIVEEYREERVRGGIVRSRTDYEHKIDHTQCGLLFTGISA